MCMQCYATAATAVGGASGMRAWVAARSPRWLTPRRMRVLTAVLLTIAVLASGVRA